MFNRAIQMKIVKTNKKTEKDSDQTPTTTTAEYVQIARETGRDVAVAAVAIIGTYVVLDTLRKVTIKIVEAKL